MLGLNPLFGFAASVASQWSLGINLVLATTRLGLLSLGQVLTVASSVLIIVSRLQFVEDAMLILRDVEGQHNYESLAIH